MSCPKGGNHSPVQVSTSEIEVGDEIVVYSRVECSKCGTGIENKIISRRKKK